jgi:hypothetical protein
MSIRINQTHYQVLPIGEYVAKITEIVEEDGKFGLQLKFTFDMLAPDLYMRYVTGWCTAKFSKKSKLYAWTKAALGGNPIPEDWAFDSDDILNKIVRLELVTEEKDDGETYNQIHAVKPGQKGDEVCGPAGVPFESLDPQRGKQEAMPF